MKGRISVSLRIFLLIATFTYISFDSIAQFYVGGKLCIGSAAPTTPPASSGSSSSNTTTDCTGEPTIFFDEDKDATAWQWNFGDPNSTTDVSNLRNPQYFYSIPGKYTVTLIRTVNGTVQPPVTKEITISEPPEQPLLLGKAKGETTVCDGKTLTLDPYSQKTPPPGVKFLWFPGGETTQTINVTKTGCYSVEVFDAAGGCSRIAQINVKFCLQESNGGGTEKWYFGDGATLDFQAITGSPIPRDPLASSGALFGDPQQNQPVFVPTPATASNPVKSPEGVAMVYDPKGSLVFYTDGIDVYDADNNLVPAIPSLTDGKLDGTNTATQSAVIIPKNTCNECPHHLYYIYTINKNTGLLSYSVVDIRRNNGKGAIIEKNVPVNLQTSQRITAIKTQDETGFYVYSHDAGTNTFRILKVESTGTTEFTQNLGLVHDDATSQQGYMKISGTGAKLAIAVVKGGKNYVEVFDINPATGRLGSSPLTIDLGIPAPPNVYGVEFSDDEKKLYVTLKGDPTKGETSYLYQLNLILNDPKEITNKKIKIDESAILSFGALQSGPVNGPGNKSIYMAIEGSRYIPYIQLPNELGNASVVGYQPITGGSGADLLGTSGWGFPNVIQAKQNQEGEGLGATYEGNCQNQPTIFKTEGVCSPMKAEATWDFGDGTTGTGLTTSHIYTKPGKYKIKLMLTVYSETVVSQNINIPLLNNLLGNALKEKCKDFIVNDEIYIKPTPELNLPDETFVCIPDGEKITLDPKGQNLDNPKYLWNYESRTTPTIEVNAAGIVSVKVTNVFANATTCLATDNVEVKEGCEPRLFVPEIFTVNNDYINDVLDIPHAYIKDFDLRIYNRWGEIIFESSDPDNRWDGSYKGEVMAPMMYAYVVSYKSSYFPNREKITKRGGIFLVN
ncbi:PKD domain containing protein [Emticicia oligotrophica DSM 17448]|uniref:PKD domain containing protein n=1 Tax=Emticicia oligotrophica (strain DSM 17448 / CIP 109782 / MTCC 6937 / GPTSA100-15) TaxID=929562 RepID=A0ABN4AM31_EMTOG|nr:PKD domain-containing protein [Emticicia oligotrophica]AFK03196.1 PKD domain containing protein [Emticicia oligotrophica DSM 17448]